MRRRYESLQLHDALSRKTDYAEACRELRCVVRAVFVYASRPLQALLFDDVVHAFRVLPRMENIRQFGAAKLLMQAVEGLFSEERLVSVVHEYETAVSAWHGRSGNTEPQPGRSELSGDTLVHVFEYLDARSLAVASSVCKEWNVVASDDALWRNQYLYLTSGAKFHESEQDTHPKQVLEELTDFVKCGPRSQLWRKAFSLALKDWPSNLFTSGRACCVVCGGVMWVAAPPWASAQGGCVGREHHSLQPMSASQVVRYVVSRDTGGRDDCANKLSRVMECTNFFK